MCHRKDRVSYETYHDYRYRPMIIDVVVLVFQEMTFTTMKKWPRRVH
jgi:hypothetical protein